MIEALIVSNVILWIVVVALAATVLALTRQIGVLHERIAPAGALAPRDGPPLGAPAPVFDVADLEGRALRIGGESADGRATLVLFVSPTCPVCRSLLPTAERLAEAERARLVLASDGPAEEHVGFVREHGLERFPYVLSTELGLAHRVGRLPWAILIDERGTLRGKGLVNTREHLESLFEARERGVGSIQEYLAKPAA